MVAVIDLARMYAENMDGWRAEPGDERGADENALLVNDSERVKLRIATQWRTDRLTVRAVIPWQPGVSGVGVGANDISISSSRPPAAAAKDILRRAVPAAIDATRQYEANVERHKAMLAEVAAVRADLTAAAPALTPRPGDESLDFDWRPPQDDNGETQWGTVKLHTRFRHDPGTGAYTKDGYAGDIDLHGLTLDQVKRVIRALAGEG